jgi:4'-phosphopantetheinyl transferase
VTATVVPVDPSEPHVWWARRQDASPRLEMFLDGPEVKRLSAYVRAEDRARFLVGCGLAKLVLARQLGREATEIRLSRACPRCGRPHGKPRLAAPVVTAPPELSISHSGELVAVAVTARTAVGIDVERYDRVLPVHDLEEVVLAETERRELARLRPGDRARGFLTW